MTLATAASSVVAHWALDETSGTRADSVGSNDLTDNNTVTSTSGKFGNAAVFDDANSEYLSVSDNTALSGGDIDFMLRCWVRIDSTAATAGIMSKWDSGGSREYQLRYRDTTNRFQFRVLGPAEISLIDADNYGDVPVDTWCLVHAWHDATANQIGIAVNAGTASTSSHSVGVNDSSAQFEIGRDGPSDLEYLGGQVDDALFLRGYILDGTERTEDYNDGTGVAFEDWAGGQTEACSGTSAWSLDSTATLTCDVPVDATSAWTSDSTATLTCSVPLSGTSLWTSDTTASMSSTAPCSATSAWTSDSTASLTCSVPLAGTSPWTSGQSSQLAKLVPIGSTSTWTSDSTGLLTIAGGFAGTSLWTSDSTGAITIAAGLAATSAWISGASGSLVFSSSLRAVDNGRASHLDRRDIAAMLNGSPSAASLDAHAIAASLPARAIASKAHKRSAAALTIQN